MIGLTLEAVETLRDEVVIANVAKGSKELLRVSVRVSESGASLVTVRLWQRVGAELVPTKAGFNLTPGALGELLVGLQRAQRAVERRDAREPPERNGNG